MFTEYPLGCKGKLTSIVASNAVTKILKDKLNSSIFIFENGLKVQLSCHKNRFLDTRVFFGIPDVKPTEARSLCVRSVDRLVGIDFQLAYFAEIV